MKLYEILLPETALENHISWDTKVVKITGGLTILSPIKGKWHDSMLEVVVPVRIATTPEKMREIALMTKEHYDQGSVIFYEISPNVEFV